MAYTNTDSAKLMANDPARGIITDARPERNVCAETSHCSGCIRCHASATRDVIACAQFRRRTWKSVYPIDVIERCVTDRNDVFSGHDGLIAAKAQV
jgi:hypothetical protein